MTRTFDLLPKHIQHYYYIMSVPIWRTEYWRWEIPGICRTTMVLKQCSVLRDSWNFPSSFGRQLLFDVSVCMTRHSCQIFIGSSHKLQTAKISSTAVFRIYNNFFYVINHIKKRARLYTICPKQLSLNIIIFPLSYQIIVQLPVFFGSISKTLSCSI